MKFSIRKFLEVIRSRKRPKKKKKKTILVLLKIILIIVPTEQYSVNYTVQQILSHKKIQEQK